MKGMRFLTNFLTDLAERNEKMSNLEHYGIGNPGRLLWAWNEYKQIIEETRPGSEPRFAITNPFYWLAKPADLAIHDSFKPGRLVVDSQKHYGIVIERRSEVYSNCPEPTIDQVVVDFKGTRGRVIEKVRDLKPVEFPPELIEFAISGKKDGLKEKVHEKVEEAFNG